MAFDQLKQGFDTVKTIDPPGIDVFKDGSKFDWGLRPTSLGMRGDMLALEMAGFVADPDMNWDEHLPFVPPPLPPVLGGRAETDYDLALVVNNSVIQRVLFLAYTRGNLAPVGIPDEHCNVSQQAPHVMSPIFKSGTDGHARMDVRLSLARDGSVGEWWALKDPFQVMLALDVKTQMATGSSAPANGFDLVLDHVMADESYVDPRFIEHSEGSVRSGLHDRLTSGGCSLTRKLTDTPIEAPTDLFGLPLRLLQTEFDPHGYLVLYMAFGERS
jgi:hypothetical protein